MMLNIFSVFFGGGLGAVLRYLISLNISKHIGFPFSTFLVNLVGSFLIGFLTVIFIEKSDINPALKISLTVGVCGGLTTFSTFSLELYEMITNNLIFNALLYIALSILLCLSAVTIGVWCAKII